MRVDDKWIGIGQRGSDDFTMHKCPVKQAEWLEANKALGRYWTVKTGDYANLYTQAFWEYHLLWSNDSLEQALKSLETLQVNVIYTKNTIDKHYRLLVKEYKQQLLDAAR